MVHVSQDTTVDHLEQVILYSLVEDFKHKYLENMCLERNNNAVLTVISTKRVNKYVNENMDLSSNKQLFSIDRNDQPITKVYSKLSCQFLVFNY